MQAKDWISLRLGIVLSFLMTGGFVYAQRADRAQMAIDEKNFNYTLPGENFSSNVRLNEIKPAAFRSFRRQFPDIQNESWSKMKKGYLIRFRGSDSSVNYAVLDRRGAFIRKIACYSAHNVPEDLKEAVRYAYSSYEIESATKWSNERNEYYGVLICHEGYKKSLEFRNGEFYVLAEYTQVSY